MYGQGFFNCDVGGLSNEWLDKFLAKRCVGQLFVGERRVWFLFAAADKPILPLFHPVVLQGSGLGGRLVCVWGVAPVGTARVRVLVL